MALLIEMAELHNRTAVFANRQEAGQMLAAQLKKRVSAAPIVLAIPAGGVPVAREVADFLQCPFDLLLVKKIEIPWDSEAGFGAVNLAGETILDEALLQSLMLQEGERRGQIDAARELLAHRNRLYRGRCKPPALCGRTVILVDDGLASGCTMLAALHTVRPLQPAEIIVAVPTGMSDTVNSLTREADMVACLNIREAYPFAVAAAYRNWNDVSDAEVLQLIRKPSPGRDPAAGGH